MLATELRELAVKDQACNSGLRWLDDWIKEHPQGTASDFFTEQRNVPLNYETFSPAGYLRWSFQHLLDWSAVQNGIDILSYFPDPAAAKLCQQLIDQDSSFGANPEKIADALARAYK